MKQGKKVLIVVVAVLAVLILALVIYYASQSQVSGPSNSGNPVGSAGVPGQMLQNQTPAAAQATQALINEVGSSTVTETAAGSGTAGTNGGSTTPQVIKVAIVSPGTSGINVSSGQVVTPQGVAVSNNVAPASPTAPQSSFPINPSSVPSSAIKLAVTSSSFTPNQFTVSAGQAVSLVVSNVNETTFSEVLRFDDPSLSAVVVGVAKGETKSITFNAPSKAGSYAFYSAMFNHRDLGAVGTMIVK